MVAMVTMNFRWTTLCIALLLIAFQSRSEAHTASAFTTPNAANGRGLDMWTQGLQTGSLHLRAEAMTQDLDSVTEAVDDEQPSNTGKRRVAVLVCPAQFCVPADYTTLLDDIRTGLEDDDAGIEVVAGRVAPLPRTEWIKVAKQLPTKNFLDAELSVRVTLDWYFDAMEKGLAELYSSAGEDVEVCIVGHSIGGWVARAYLGGLSGSSTAVFRHTSERCTSLITLGTPHTSPETALVDQTRGLLREVASTSECSADSLFDRGIKVTCVGSSGLAGKILSGDIEEIVAATSYLPLVGRLGDDVRGDGIVPTDLAFMDAPARRVVIEKCDDTGGAVRHAHVLPTPWNLLDGSAPSISLPDDFLWYGSPGVIRQWLKYIE